MVGGWVCPRVGMGVRVCTMHALQPQPHLSSLPLTHPTVIRSFPPFPLFFPNPLLRLSSSRIAPWPCLTHIHPSLSCSLPTCWYHTRAYNHTRTNATRLLPQPQPPCSFDSHVSFCIPSSPPTPTPHIHCPFPLPPLHLSPSISPVDPLHPLCAAATEGELFFEGRGQG